MSWKTEAREYIVPLLSDRHMGESNAQKLVGSPEKAFIIVADNSYDAQSYFDDNPQQRIRFGIPNNPYAPSNYVVEKLIVENIKDSMNLILYSVEWDDTEKFRKNRRSIELKYDNMTYLKIQFEFGCISSLYKDTVCSPFCCIASYCADSIGDPQEGAICVVCEIFDGDGFMLLM